MNATSYEDLVLEREYEGDRRSHIPGVVGAERLYEDAECYELGRRDGTMWGLVIGSISGAIMTLVVTLLF